MPVPLTANSACCMRLCQAQRLCGVERTLRLVVEKGRRTVSVGELWVLEGLAGIALLDQRGMLL